MIVLNNHGDERTFWNTGDAASIEHAMAEFDRLVRLGYRAARMDSPETGVMIGKFDPDAETLTMVPRIHAG